MLPRIVLHTAISLDGRTTGFPIDIGQFYRLAATWKEDATLAGCDTILAGLAANEEGLAAGNEAAEGKVDSAPASELDVDPDTDADSAKTTGSENPAAVGERPLLVIPDSRGRIRRWGELLRYPYWRGGVALCSQATPIDYVEYLYANDIDCIVWGKDHVDLKKCLAELADRHDVQTVRVDSGGTLAQTLLRQRLVDEISLLIHPVIVGSASGKTFFELPPTAGGGVAPATSEFPLALRLIHNGSPNEGLVWTRHEVLK